MTFAVMEQTMDFLYQLSNRTVLLGWGIFSLISVAHMCILIWLYDHEKPKTLCVTFSINNGSFAMSHFVNIVNILIRLFSVKYVCA